MKGLKKLVLVSAIAAAPFAQAELKAIDDAAMSEMTGQSGLLIEVGMGTTTATAASTGAAAWADAGITIDAFKWEVDLEAYDSVTNVHTTTATGAQGGVVAQNIAIAGALDVTVDGVLDGAAQHGGIGIGFENSNISMRVGDIATFGAGQVGASMGSIEIIGMNLDGLDLTISGRGVANP